MARYNQFTVPKDRPLYFRKIYQSFRDQKRRCYDQKCKEFKYYGAKGIKIEYTFDEFLNWYKKEFEKKIIIKPSVGRVDHSKNYSIDNIELIEKSENSAERIRRCGTPYKMVSCNAYKNGEWVGWFCNLNLAGKVLGVHSSKVSEIVNKKRKSSGGYTFIGFGG